MQTLHYTTKNFMSPVNNIIDLQQYRRSIEPAACLQTEEESIRPVKTGKSYSPQRILPVLLDAAACIGIITMTAVFTLHIVG